MTEFVDPYVDPAIGILRNLVGARTRAELDTAEADLVHARHLNLHRVRIKPTRDLAELRAIHRYLFQDVYDWAGELRTVDLRKNVEGAEFFMPAPLIERAAGFAASELAADNALVGMDRERFIAGLAHHYDQFNYVHPFREGNGRAQRAFWDRVAVDAGWRLEWTRVSGDVNDAACRAASESRDFSLLLAMFEAIVEPAAT